MTKSDPRGIRTLPPASNFPNLPGHLPPPLNIPTASSTTSLPPPDPAATNPATQRTSELLRRAAALIDGLINDAQYMTPIPAPTFAVANELRVRALLLERACDMWGVNCGSASQISAAGALRAIGEVRP